MTIQIHTATVGEWEGTHKPIVVGVDGTESSHRAVAWAAREAAALGCAVLLVVAVPHGHARGCTPGVRTRHQEALDLLADARSRVRHLVDEQTVSAVVQTGHPVPALLEHAAGSRLLVVGRGSRSSRVRPVRDALASTALGSTLLGSTLLGSTSQGLALRSPVPVVIIPDDWSEGAGEDRQHPVVLGVDPEHHPCHRPWHVAFARARRLQVPLLVVHGRVPSPTSWESDGHGGAGEQTREADRSVDELLTTWRERFPDVSVRCVHVPRPGAQAVLEAAGAAQLVVLGRGGGGRGATRLGSVTHHVLRVASCPVLVVPVDPPDVT